MRQRLNAIFKCRYLLLQITAIVLVLAEPGLAGSALAQPVYRPLQQQIPAPLDHVFPGEIDIAVDASDTAHRIYTVHERIPVAGATRIILLYPQWEAASHGPSLTVTDLAGLTITSGAQELVWARDPYVPHAFHIEVPPDARVVDVRFQMVRGDGLITDTIVSVPWQRMLLYPAGWYTRNIMIRASLKLPEGFRGFSSLMARAEQDGVIKFAATSLETLLDSPVVAGSVTREVALGEERQGAVSLALVGDDASLLDVPEERKAQMKRLVGEIRAVFGSTPFDHYTVLARLEKNGEPGGTEHRASTELTLPGRFFTNWDTNLLSRDLLAHEIVHAWNGLYRIPQDLWAPTPNVPVAGSLLWLYEGQTEFWGRLLATRAGQMSAEELRDRLALDAAEVATRPGRAWRPLSDDVNYPSFMLRQPMRWRDWQRRRDYYTEGVMLWLAVDAELRQRSGGRYGMDAFAAHFFAGASPNAPVRTYSFADVCNQLNALAPGDWAGFLRGWIDAHEELDTNAGLTRHGWALVFTDTPGPAYLAAEREDGVTDLTYSLGLAVNDAGVVREVHWDGPAFRAGLRPRLRITAVNGQKLSRDALLMAVRNAARKPVVLSVEDAMGGRVHQMTIAYDQGLRYPHLKRIGGMSDGLAPLIAPRAPAE